MTGRALDGSIATIRIVPKDSPAANPAFDVTPARLVSGLITERGLCAANATVFARDVPRPCVKPSGCCSALGGCAAPDAHAPPFARVPYEPFSRSAAVAIATDEWRLWGMRVDDNERCRLCADRQRPWASASPACGSASASIGGKA